MRIHRKKLLFWGRERLQRARLVQKAFASFALCFILSGCDSEVSDPGGPYLAQVMELLPTSQANEGAQFQVVTRELKLLSNLNSLEGDFFKIVSGGRLSVTSIQGSQAADSRFTGGTSPPLRYRIENGVVVPRDYLTLATVSAFYQYEQVFLNMESLIGLTANAYREQNGQAEVIFEPTVFLRTDSSEVELTTKLNAAFIPEQKQFVLFRRSAFERAPIALNLQVISHEFGHAAFEQSFYQNAFDEESRFAKDLVISGFNEGFADVLSWAMTGSADVLRGSFGAGDSADLRNFASVDFTFKDLIEPAIEKCAQNFYCIGTLFASGVHKAHQTLGLSNSFADRTTMSRDVFDALTKTQASLRELSSDILPAEESEESSLGQGFDEDDGKVAGAFLRAFLLNLRADWREAFCAGFVENFGVAGFPLVARDGVCS